MKLRAKGRCVEWEGGGLDLFLPVLEAIRIGDYIIVIHNCTAYPPEGPASNLVAYSSNGQHIWTAETLTKTSPTDAYTSFISEEPLWVANFECFNCKIDLQTGRLLEKVFTK